MPQQDAGRQQTGCDQHDEPHPAYLPEDEREQERKGHVSGEEEIVAVHQTLEESVPRDADVVGADAHRRQDDEERADGEEDAQRLQRERQAFGKEPEDKDHHADEQRNAPDDEVLQSHDRETIEEEVGSADQVDEIVREEVAGCHHAGDAGEKDEHSPQHRPDVRRLLPEMPVLVENMGHGIFRVYQNGR